MYMAAMTSRERWLALFNRQAVDRVPTDIWATPEVFDRLFRELGCANKEELCRKLHIDAPADVWPPCKIKHHPDDPQAGIWGVRTTVINYGTGEYGEASYAPLAACETVEDVHRFKWPSPDWFDYSAVTEMVRKLDGTRIVRGSGYEPFLLYCSMRGMEQAYEDLLVNPEIAHAALTHIFDFYYEHNRRSWEAAGGKVDYMYLAEDLGGQSSPLFSLETYRTFLRPNQVKMAALAKSMGIKVFYHTDGAAQVFLDDLINVVGVDVLNPLQWRCPGMSREFLAEKIAPRIMLHGGIDNQQTLPFGTVEDVVSEVKDCARIFKDARWICAPCHNIQPVTPTANIVAMYETIHAIGVK